MKTPVIDFDLPVSLRIRCSISQAFDAWTAPDLARLWLCDELGGEWVSGKGIFWRFGEHRQEILVLSVETNRRLHLRWPASGTQPETEVEIEFISLENETGIRIRESKWTLSHENVQFALDHACGWENILCRLKAFLEVGAIFSSVSGSFSLDEGNAEEKNTPMLRTERLVLRLPGENEISKITSYYRDNEKHLAPTDPPKHSEFYTDNFWRERIQQAKEEFAADRGLRFYLFNADSEAEIIGTIGFSQFVRGPFQACYLGYGISHRYESRGLMFEALNAAIEYVFTECNMHRLMANHLVDNHRSAKLLQRLGFQREGIAKNYLFINGAWRDHALTSLENLNWKDGEFRK